MGPGPHVAIGDSRHPLTIWSLLCGRTAAGRKGTAEAVARRVLTEAEPFFMKDNIMSGLSSAEGLIAALADDDEEGPADPDADKRRLVLEPEFGVVLARARREGNAISQVLREAWDGRDLRVATKTPLIATAPHLAVNGHISPEEFRARVSQRDVAGGSYNRFLLLYVERSKRLPDGGGAAQDVVREMADDLRTRLARARRVGEIRRAVSAADYWRHLYNELVDLEDDPVVSDWVARCIPQVMRLAALYAALDGTAEIQEHHLRAAAALVRYAMDSVRYVVQGGEAQPRSDVAYVSKLSKQAGPDGINRSALTKAFGSRGDAAALDATLTDVMALPGFESKEVKTGGRPSRCYRYQEPGLKPGHFFLLLAPTARTWTWPFRTARRDRGAAPSGGARARAQWVGMPTTTPFTTPGDPRRPTQGSGTARRPPGRPSGSGARLDSSRNATSAGRPSSASGTCSGWSGATG